MAEFQLTARPPLGVEPIVGDGVEAGEVLGLSIVSIAAPIGGEAELGVSVNSVFGIGLPAVGEAIRSENDGTWLLGLQPGQWFAVFECPEPRPLDVMRAKVADAAYLTDQSDSFAIVRIKGARSREALERICPIDLHPDEFSVGTVTRTLMEHLGVIILREDEDAFMLMSARSSARSFWHAVETSIRNVA